MKAYMFTLKANNYKVIYLQKLGTQEEIMNLVNEERAKNQWRKLSLTVHTIETNRHDDKCKNKAGWCSLCYEGFTRITYESKNNFVVGIVDKLAGKRKPQHSTSTGVSLRF
jgi:hypothetical protein